ncbi:hypothetical protein V8F20_000087, partial [Naviculisporaceae sp. PSN 640]
MFYSHEILTSHQYGVATIWLVSTFGLRSTNRKISRKAIQEVNVRKACETIIKPGAPIALRLQSSLLYGVSRVYSQQCNYVLSDAEKVQSHMRAFYNVMGGSEHTLDPEAGKARRDQLIIQDDPEFYLNMDLPVFELEDFENVLDPKGPQASQKTSSQLSPLQRDSFSADGNSLLANFDLTHSTPGGGSSQLQSPFRLQEPSQHKDADGDVIMELHENDEIFQSLEDWGLEIDADGNIAPMSQEPELPVLPRQTPAQELVSSQQGGPNNLLSDNQGDIMMNSDGVVLPDADAFPLNQPDQAGDQVVGAAQAAMPARRRRARHLIPPDGETTLSRAEMKRWNQDFLAIAEQARRTRSGPTPSEAKKNGYNMVFGNGIAKVGIPTGITELPQHPLQNYFAGENLQALVLGLNFGPKEDEVLRGRRRTASEALELEVEDGRRVRRRLFTEVGQLPLSQNGSAILGEEEREVGREAGSGLPDLPSDTAWHRGSSQVPGSSIKGSAVTDRFRAGSRQVTPSPLHGRGSHILSDNNIERFSDQPVFGSDGNFLSLHSANDAFSEVPGTPGARLESQHGGSGSANTSQLMREALDRDSTFLGHIKTVAKDKGPDHERDENGRAWVDFTDLFDGPDTNRHVAVQSFYHILVLATKDAVKVRQECVNMQPYGRIQVGV